MQLLSLITSSPSHPLRKPSSILSRCSVVALVLLAITACQKNGDGSASSQGAQPATQATSMPLGYVLDGPGKPGGTLHVSSSTDTVNLDPHGISAAYLEWLGRLLFDNLVYLDDKGHPQPWLATSWEISPDRKTYTFHLRDDVTFSDGTKFNAEAVLINLDHIRDPATRSPLAARYIAPYQDGKALDDYTLQLNLKEPYAPFLEVLAQTWLGMVSPKQIQENPKSIIRHPIGSGPFILDTYTPQQGISLNRRPDYHWAPPYIHHDGPAFLDRIEVDFVTEALVRYTSLVSGQFDMTFEAPPQYCAQIRADPSLAIDNRYRIGVPIRSITFNTEREPFNDRLVRKGFTLAVDQEGVAKIMGFGEYIPTTEFLAPNTRYYDPSFKDVLRTNLQAANQALDQAGWTGRDSDGYRTKNGQRLTANVTITETATPSAAIVAIQSDVKKVGFELKIQEVPAPQLTIIRNTGDYQAMGGGGWHSNTPDVLFVNYHSQEIIHGDFLGLNVSRLHDAVLDDVLQRARVSNDPVELQSLYSQAQKLLVEDVPGVPSYLYHTITARKTYVKGVIADTSHNTLYLIGTWLDR